MRKERKITLESVVNQVLRKKKLQESYDTKYENATNTIEYYLWLSEHVRKFTPSQCEQLSEIVDWLKETDASDNPNLEYWINSAEELLSKYGEKPMNEKKSGGIHIKPENKGKFTATKKRTGKSTSELLQSKNPKTRQRANFARMAKRGWKPLEESMANLVPDIIDWAMNKADKQSRVGGPVNAIQAIYDYYYNNDEEALWNACEAFCEYKGIELTEDVWNDTIKAANYFVYYNPKPEDEKDSQTLVNENEDNDGQDYFYTFVDVLEECGWGYSNFEEVKSKTSGQTGVRFGIDASRNDSCTLEELKNKLKQAIPENLLVFSMGQHRYAPEIKRMSVVLLDNQPEQQEQLSEEETEQTPQNVSWQEILQRINKAGVNQAMPRQETDVNTETSTDSQHVFNLGSYTYNAGQHLLTGPEGFSKYLSKTEADLMLILCENINQVVPRENFLKALWNKPSQSEEGNQYFNARSMDVYMTKLRQYLANDPDVNIFSVRGVGFKLEVRK